MTPAGARAALARALVRLSAGFLLLLTGLGVGQDLELRVFDVGQGDAVLVRAAGGQAVLYDGGPSPDGALQHLRRAGVERLDLIVASHAHADHVGGLPEVLRAFEPRFYLDNGVTHPTLTYRRLLEAVAEAGSELLAPEARRIGLGAASLHVLPPPAAPELGQNGNSVGLLVELGAFRALLAGDATPATFDHWSRTLPDVLAPVSVYRASHHGSRDGDTRRVLEALRPETVIISAGEGNAYGHPHREALARYGSVASQLYRTDLHGTVVVSAWRDGRYQVEVEREAVAETEADPNERRGEAPSDAPVRVACVLYDPEGRDDGHEEVTLIAARDVDVSDWSLTDEADHVLPVPARRLTAGEELVVPNHGRPVWNNGGDTATLRDASGREVDALAYPGGGAGRACR